MQIPFRAYINRQTLITLKNIYNIIHTTIVSIFPRKMNTPTPTPPPFNPSEPSSPISYPIKTLEELESRSYFDSFHYPFNKSSACLQGVRGNAAEKVLPMRPRLLVCHDMAGGYSDDKWVQGGNNPDAYAIWHWYLMDVFVYFSHSLVTLPPPCWVNAGHLHGVKVLGTFITEWDEGKVITRKLLETKESAHMYAERLTELAVSLGFDGWLINMEVEVDIGQIPNLKEFVSHLTRTMHSSKAGSLVIWYDSVTTYGKLEWQDHLNDSNKPYFDVCDGIFVNYTWKANYPKLSADVAGSRNFDVYMGIDIFGRGTYGGGQWTTNVALDIIKKDNVSAAIFAPGWVLETNQPPDFQTAQNRWWDLVEKSWGVSQNYPKSLPFYSNFDQGHGYHIFVDGRQVSTNPWNNISCQSFQPLLEYSEDLRPSAIKVSTNVNEASYSGGGNITLQGSLDGDTYFTTRIFQGELLFGNLPVLFTFSVKSDVSSMVGLSLEFSSSMLEKTSVLLASRGDTVLNTKQLSSKFTRVIMPHKVKRLDATPEWEIQESRLAMEGYTLTGIHIVCYKSKPDAVNHEIVTRGPSEYNAVLGHIEIRTTATNSDFPPDAAWLVEGQFIKWTPGSEASKTLSVKISWKLKDETSSSFPSYNIYVEKEGIGGNSDSLVEERLEYLGLARVEAFYISDLVVPSGTSRLNFIIQVCSLDGTLQKLDRSPSFQLNVEDPLLAVKC
ncbi:Mannosyl-glycoprotein endo-beta-N-acetylglucosaminidase [Heracleum sosnowskyi]|uniref:mannosyl-glycoprotein endo-beta-N-acetylglucosaminidase n=1 Tax=Heracleum sosnowskyi TaxID=360622 RepID=A0AAD8M0D9_9APIA|nr:Mannosyl-glycoprotein endo-beta-N-acetylglucosaminidase [Heracleum sosnowskyi]